MCPKPSDDVDLSFCNRQFFFFVGCVNMHPAADLRPATLPWPLIYDALLVFFFLADALLADYQTYKTMSAKAIHEAVGKAMLARAMPAGTCRKPLSATVTPNTDWDALLAANPWLNEMVRFTR
jgi:hypothetical protein